jgi:glycosyltransferase involved in cell wall biosynthesis
VKDVTEILKASDVFVLPSSVREGLSISLLEAMAARRPVVVTDIGGNRETVEWQTGIVVPRGLGGARRNSAASDPALARTLGDAARAKVDREFGVSRMIRQTEDLYDALLAGKRP